MFVVNGQRNDMNRYNECYSRCRISNYNSEGVLTVLDSDGELLECNNTFYEVWCRLDGKTKTSSVVKEILNQYDVSNHDEIREDVMNVIDDMLKYGLINKDNNILPQINHVENCILSSHIAITSCCNLNCSHCYLDHKNHSSITANEFEMVLRNLAQNGILTIEMSGGEPLTHSQCLNFLRRAKEYGFYIKLFTNATLINSANLDNLKKYVDCFRVSLDGGERVHDLRRGRGTFSKTLYALQLLRNCKVQISMTVDDNNYSDIDIVRRISDELGMRFELSPVVPYPHLQIPFDKLKFIQEQINKSLLDKMGSDSKRANIQGINCEAAIRLLYINSQLDVFPCPLLYNGKWFVGNLRNASLQELLNCENYKKVVRSLNRLKTKCVACNKCQYWCAAIVEQTKDKRSPFCSWKR